MSVCDECAMRLFNSKHYNLKGVGNPYYGKCIIVPNVDYNAYKKGDMSFSSQVEIIKSVISSTGEVDDVFILPLIRCNESISCDLTDDIYKRCLMYLAEDMYKFDFKDIMLLGDAGRRFLNCNINEYFNSIIVSPNNRRYAVNYSPLIKYIDNTKFEIFKNYLLRWYISAKNEYFEQYNFIQL